MNKKTGIALLAGGLVLAAIVAIPVWAGSGAGHLMELTIHVKQTMSGLPAIPPRTMQKKICTRPGAFNARDFTKTESQSDCKIEHYTKHDKVVSFDVMCTKPEPVTSHGEFHLTGGPNFTGSMHTAFNAAGHAISVDTEYAGKEVGTCTYQPPKTSG